MFWNLKNRVDVLERDVLSIKYPNGQIIHDFNGLYKHKITYRYAARDGVNALVLDEFPSGHGYLSVFMAEMGSNLLFAISNYHPGSQAAYLYEVDTVRNDLVVVDLNTEKVSHVDKDFFKPSIALKCIYHG